MKRKLWLIAAAAMICTVMFALGVSAATHSHPICGASCDCTNTTHANSATWTAWDGSTKMTSGYYYLTKDVELSQTMVLNNSYSTAYLCLNGHTISCTNDIVFNIYSSFTLYICDCKGSGAVKTTNGFAAIQNNNKLTIFSGSVIGENYSSAIYNCSGKSVTVYGGEITSTQGSPIYSDGNVTVYDGKISGKWDSITVTSDASPGNLQIYDGEFNGTVGNSSNGSTIITGGVFNDTQNGWGYSLSCEGKATISGGTFNGICNFSGATSISGGNFNCNVFYGDSISLSGSSAKLYLNGNPSINQIGVSYPNAISAKSSDGTKSYSGGEIIIRGSGLKNGDIAVSNVTSANSKKFVGDPDTCELTLSGTNLLYRYTYCEKFGHSISTTSSSGGTCSNCGATGGKCGANAYWGLDSAGTLVVSGSGDMYDYYYNSSPWYSKTVNKLIILDSITRIGNYAFSNCDMLTSIKLPSPTTTLAVGRYAFGYCDKLTAIDFGTCPRVVGEGKTFYECNALVSVTVPANVVGNSEMFMCCRNLKTAVVSCEVLDSFMFEYCDALETIVLNEGVKTINSGVFANGRSLKSVVFPQSLERITDGIFHIYDGGTNYLESITFLSDTTIIPNNLTNNDKALTAGFTVYGPGCSTAARYAQQAEHKFEATDSSTHQAAVSADCTANSLCAKCGYVMAEGNEAHIFTTYKSNNDGTETAVCDRDGCEQTDTRERVNAAAPTLSAQPASATYTIGNPAEALTVTAEITDSGTLTYQWYENTTNSNTDGTTISGATSASYTPSTSAVGTKYYYVVVTNTNTAATGEQIVSTVSQAAAVTVKDFVASGACGDNLTWTLDDAGTLTISGTGDMWDWTHDTRETASWNAYRSSVSKVVIEPGVTSIGDLAFYNFRMTSVAIPDSVTSIGTEAFMGCWRLTSVTIPKSVTSIGARPFQSCENLESVTVDSDNTAYMSQDGVLYNKDMTTLITYPAAKTVFSIPDSVTSIADYAFCYCSAMTSITIPKNVVSIGYDVFWNCTGLASITVDSANTAYTDVDGVLYDKNKTRLILCPSQKTSCDIPDTVTVIQSRAFWKCTAITSITLPNSIVTINNNAFNGCSSLTSIIIPDGVTSLNYGVFHGCTALESITIPASVTQFGNQNGDDIFKDSPDILTIYGYTGSAAETYAEKKSITFSSIGVYVEPPETPSITVNFKAGSCLQGETAPTQTVTASVSDGGTLSYQWYVSTTGSNTDGTAISGATSASYTPSTDVVGTKYYYVVVTNTKNAETGSATSEKASGVVSITVKAPSHHFAIQTFTYGGVQRVSVTGYSGTGGHVEIPAVNSKDNKAVNHISSSAFKGNTKITAVTFPDTLACIPTRAFYGTSLSEVTIPASTEYIGREAFGNCSKLKTAYIENRETVIDLGAFPDDCRIVYVDGKEEKSYGDFMYYTDGTKAVIVSYTGIGGAVTVPMTITDGTGTYTVTAIGRAAFANKKSVTSVSLPETITTIRELAFYNCTALTSVPLPSFLTYVGPCAFYGCSALTSIIVPEGVTQLFGSTFDGMTSLSYLRLPASLTEVARPTRMVDNNYEELKNCPLLVTAGPIGSGCNLEFGWTETIPGKAFWNMDALTTVTLPETITLLGGNSFWKCSALTKLVIPASVTNIVSTAIRECPNLTIYGYIGSNAETYAKDNNIPFVPLYTIRGSITSSGSGDISITLLRDGVSVEGVTITVDSAAGTYSIKNVPAGTYVLRVSKAKHVPREYTVTV